MVNWNLRPLEVPWAGEVDENVEEIDIPESNGFQTLGSELMSFSSETIQYFRDMSPRISQEFDDDIIELSYSRKPTHRQLTQPQFEFPLLLLLPLSLPDCCYNSLGCRKFDDSSTLGASLTVFGKYMLFFD
jgi:hypothetical protein